jgi:hypothetical protein
MGNGLLIRRLEVQVLPGVSGGFMKQVTPVTWALAPKWLSIPEASHLSGLDVPLLRSLIEDGGVDARREGDDWVIEKQLLQEYQEALALVANWDVR